MNRRYFLIQSLLGSCALLVPFESFGLIAGTEPKSSYFLHGVASGDAEQERTVIWTRISEDTPNVVEVRWEVAADQSFQNIICKGICSTSLKRDYTVKIDVDSLKAGTHYFYRFWYKGEYSPIGKFRTLPASLEKPLQIAVVSCNNYEDGYFSSFRHIAENRDIDYVFHLGDYIYEYGTGEYANSDFIKKSNRINDPLHEIVSLEDYRKRFAQYRSDKDLQQAHQEKAFFCIWDDHELANNAFVEGAKNHQPDEGDWYSRKQAALRAYFEWMPVRAGSVKEMIRKVSLGTDCNFYFLEERLDGRTKQFTLSDDEFYDEERKLISDEQMLWLKNNLEDQSVRWQ